MELQDNKTDTLGVKHKNYNKQVIDAITDKKTLDEQEFQVEQQDLVNLMKIDLAANKRYVDYILTVLKCKDMLYVSRALNKSKWLVEDKYEHIINPQYLRNQLFPNMTTEAAIKVTKFVRQHLKNESRVEEFLQSETDPKIAAKWLSRCSVTFIEKNIQNYVSHMESIEFKRICEKSVTIFDAAVENNNNYVSIEFLKSASFLINTHLEKYLDAVEKFYKQGLISFNAKATNKIMKQFPDRIKDKFEIYSMMIDMPTFVKYFKSEEIKPFLYKQAREQDNSNVFRPPRFYKYNGIKLFVSRLPKEDQFEFVKDLFIDKTALLLDENTMERDSDKYASKVLCKAVCAATPSFLWYEFAPFDVAFTEIKKLINAEVGCRDRSLMLKVLLTCTAGDMKLIQTVLTYYIAQRIKDEIHLKNDFINHVVSQTDIHKYDDDTWNLLDQIFISMNVYVATMSTQQNCLEAVIIYNLLKNQPIPEVIDKKFSFYTFRNYQKKLNKEDGMKVFDYLYNHAKKIIERYEMTNQEAFSEALVWMNFLLNLLLDWDKALTDYPFVLEKIRDFIKIKKENHWKSNLAELYNKNKSWRKHMFEESVLLSPTEDVCVNAIKHDPTLLRRYKDEVETICCDDNVSLGKLLTKIRIYWPNTLADEWSKSYTARLDKLGNHKALIRGICAILPPNKFNALIKKYTPQQAKIDWSTTDELSLSLQRVIAKNMHFARPQPSPEDILLYAKGDYLQYALPSLLAIYYNLSRVESKVQVPKLLDAPVSLQKHGLRLAFVKLDHNEVKLHMSNVWKTCKNSSIRTVAFQIMFELLRKQKNDDKALELWEIMEVFVDELSFEEDDKIYELLPRVSDVPLCVRPMFLMKSYKFLKTLIQNTKKDRDSYKYHIDRLAEYTRDIMEFIPPEFIVEIIGEFIDKNFFVYDKYEGDVRSGSGMVTVISSYLLCAKDEDVQMQRYEDLFAPIMKRALDMWNETCEGKYYIRRNIQQVLRCLLTDLNNYTIKNTMIIPTKMFTKIQNDLQSLPISENYLMITMWNLTEKLSELIEKSNEKDDWSKICKAIAPEFGKFCLDYLKEEVKLYFSCIYVLYSKALEMILSDFPLDIQMNIFECMLSDSSFIQAYLATLKVFPKYSYDDEITEKKQHLKKIIENHPSVEVKMHYYCNFKQED